MVNFCNMIIVRNIDIVAGILLSGLGIRNLDSHWLKLYGGLGYGFLCGMGFSLYYILCIMNVCAMDIKLIMGRLVRLFYGVGLRDLARGPGRPGRSAGARGRESGLSIKAGDLPAWETGQLSTGKAGEYAGNGEILLERARIGRAALLPFRKGWVYGKL